MFKSFTFRVSRAVCSLELILVGIVLLQFYSVRAQKTNAELLKEVEAKEALVIQKSRKLGNIVAKNTINKFIIKQANAIKRVAIHCERTVEAMIKTKNEMNDFTSAGKALRASSNLLELYRAMSMWQLRDVQYIEKYTDLYQQLRADAQKLAIYASHADLKKGQLLYLFPPIKEILDVGMYSNDLWSYFSKYIGDYKKAADFRYNACKQYDWDFEILFRERTQNMQTVADKIAARYITEQTATDTQAILKQLQASDDVIYGIEARKIMNAALEEYSTAIMLRVDYYRALQWLSAAEQLGVLLRSMPLNALDPSVKQSVLSQVEDRQMVVDKARQTLGSKPVHQWMESRYRFLSKQIEKGKIPCSQECKTQLTQANQLIGAAAVMHKQGNNTLFSVLAHEALDKVEGVQ